MIVPPTLQVNTQVSGLTMQKGVFGVFFNPSSPSSIFPEVTAMKKHLKKKKIYCRVGRRNAETYFEK